MCLLILFAAMDLICNLLCQERVRFDVDECMEHRWLVKDEKELEDLYDKKVKPLRPGSSNRRGPLFARLDDDIVED